MSGKVPVQGVVRAIKSAPGQRLGVKQVGVLGTDGCWEKNDEVARLGFNGEESAIEYTQRLARRYGKEWEVAESWPAPQERRGKEKSPAKIGGQMGSAKQHRSGAGVLTNSVPSGLQASTRQAEEDGVVGETAAGGGSGEDHGLGASPRSHCSDNLKRQQHALSQKPQPRSKMNALPDHKYPGQFQLASAAYKADLVAVTYFLDQGQNPLEQTSTLTWRGQDSKIEQFTLERDGKYVKCNALHWAVGTQSQKETEKRLRCLKLLAKRIIECHGDFNQRDDNQLTIMFHLAFYNRPKAIKALVEMHEEVHGPDISYLEHRDLQGDTPLTAAVRVLGGNTKEGSAAGIIALLEAGADAFRQVQVRFDGSEVLAENALHWASTYGNLAIIEAIVAIAKQRGREPAVSDKNGNGWSALHYAVQLAPEIDDCRKRRTKEERELQKECIKCLLPSSSCELLEEVLCLGPAETFRSKVEGWVKKGCYTCQQSKRKAGKESCIKRCQELLRKALRAVEREMRDRKDGRRWRGTGDWACVKTYHRWFGEWTGGQNSAEDAVVVVISDDEESEARAAGGEEEEGGAAAEEEAAAAAEEDDDDDDDDVGREDDWSWREELAVVQGGGAEVYEEGEDMLLLDAPAPGTEDLSGWQALPEEREEEVAAMPEHGEEVAGRPPRMASSPPRKASSDCAGPGPRVAECCSQDAPPRQGPAGVAVGSESGKTEPAMEHCAGMAEGGGMGEARRGGAEVRVEAGHGEEEVEVRRREGDLAARRREEATEPSHREEDVAARQREDGMEVRQRGTEVRQRAGEVEVSQRKEEVEARQREDGIEVQQRGEEMEISQREEEMAARKQEEVDARQRGEAEHGAPDGSGRREGEGVALSAADIRLEETGETATSGAAERGRGDVGDETETESEGEGEGEAPSSPVEPAEEGGPAETSRGAEEADRSAAGSALARAEHVAEAAADAVRRSVPPRPEPNVMPASSCCWILRTAIGQGARSDLGAGAPEARPDAPSKKLGRREAECTSERTDPNDVACYPAAKRHKGSLSNQGDSHGVPKDQQPTASERSGQASGERPVVKMEATDATPEANLRAELPLAQRSTPAQAEVIVILDSDEEDPQGLE